MGRDIYNPGRLKLGWFNAWIGSIISLVLFIPSFKYIFFYESLLNSSFKSLKIKNINIEVKKDSSEMKILSEKGLFYYYNKKNFGIISKASKNNKNIEIWIDEEDYSIADIKINEKFLIDRDFNEKVVYFVLFIVSGSMLLLAIILIFQTKGWGAYDLMKKHNKSLFKYLSDELDPWNKKYKI